ncbi:RNA-binding motif protein, X-linked 2 [Rhinophrynus dorsalis]
MNALTKVKLINELNTREANLGVKESVSWHRDYKDSAWIFIGGFPFELTEGDLICVFSQYGEVVNINLVRDKLSGRSRGFCFLCYEDQRSTVLAVDNLNGIKLKGRTIRVDHVASYRPPKGMDDGDDEVTHSFREGGCGIKAPSPSTPFSDEEEELPKRKKDKAKRKYRRTRNVESNQRSSVRFLRQEDFDPTYLRFQTEKKIPQALLEGSNGHKRKDSKHLSQNWSRQHQ